MTKVKTLSRQIDLNLGFDSQKFMRGIFFKNAILIITKVKGSVNCDIDFK